MFGGARIAVMALAVSQTVCGGDASTLADASMDGDLRTVRALIRRGVDPDARGAFGTPALHWRVRVDDLEGAKLLLASRADADATTERGVTPLGLAIDNGNPEMVTLLLKFGADPDLPLPTRETPLMRAAEVGALTVVQTLLEHGASVNARDPDFGQTALMFAARAGHAPVVGLLLARGADPDAATNTGVAPPFIAPNSVPGYGFGVGILRGGVPADRGRREPAPGGMTPLLYAARQGHADVARLLIEAAQRHARGKRICRC